MEEKIEEIVRLLCSSMKLERDKGVVELERSLPGLTVAERRQLGRNLLHLLTDSQNSWETKQGSLLGSRSLIPYLSLEEDADCNFILVVKQLSHKLLTDIEVRVRLAAGEVLGSLCKKIGIGVYQESKEIVLRLIQSNLDRNAADDDSSKLEQFETGKLVAKLVGGPGSEKVNVKMWCAWANAYSEEDEWRTNRMAATFKDNDAALIFQDTAGWKNLETSLKALQSMAEGCGNNFQPFIDEELLSLIFKTLTHTNHFVRETGFYVCSSLIGCGSMNDDSEVMESVSPVNPVFAFGHEFCSHLAKGLADNWSQVRLAASVAARNFLLSLPKNESREMFYPELLPKMCLNRYYAADGIRIYSQETWRQVTGTAGKELVEQYIDPTVQYYKQATLSDNHAVREAACACIAELASKISKEYVRPYVNILLNTLLCCFQDDSWPVRDAACLACGNFILCFPKESSIVMKSLYPMFFRNLSDPIPSVRQGAASALSSVVRAYGASALENIIAHIIHSLENIKKQQPESEKYLEGDKSLTRCSLFKKITDSHLDLESERHLYCSTSLVQKAGNGSCSDSSYQRESQPWEAADGCVYLIGELSHIIEIHNEIISLVPLLKEAGRYRHYASHVIFLETICKQLPMLAKNLGKKTFKSVVEEFFDIIFYSLESENALTSSAASQCLSYIATFLGPNILRGKVQNFNPSYGKCLESVIHLAPY